MAKKEENVYRGLRFEGIDKELKISKATRINTDTDAILHIDRMKDGTVRIIYNGVVVNDLSQVTGIIIVRKDEGDEHI